MMSKP